uniref:Matrin-type domain-containing protein n=1 Tax=Acartia pacifica TaxID=335913 RepID=A0A0U2V1W2_ACAPC|nr:hypothetical protein [Acartia pacifica]
MSATAGVDEILDEIALYMDQADFIDEILDDALQLMDDQEDVKGVKKAYYCRLCNVKLSSEKTKSDHLQSAKHVQNRAKAKSEGKEPTKQ